MSSIWKKWLDEFEWMFEFKFAKDRTAEEIDADTKKFLDAEIDQAVEKIAKLTRLRKQPQVFRQRWGALKQAEEMRVSFHKTLNMLQSGDTSFLTEEEKKDRQRWLDGLTPRQECKHSKGPRVCKWGMDKYAGSSYSQYGPKDYNLACHTFIDGRTKIWCMWNCGYVVWSDGDKEAYIKAKSLMEQSSNKHSASERPVRSEDEGKTYAAYIETPKDNDNGGT
jgi:hypothetical protein